MASRRSYGTGSVFIHPTVQPPTWYGQWWTPDGRRPKRKIGVARQPGSREGLTRTQAEAKLREKRAEIQITPRASGERLDVAQVGRRYRLHIERKGRKRSTVQNVESEVRVHLAPFFAGRAMDAITTEDVIDLVLLLEDSKELAPKTIRNIVATLSALFNYAMQRRCATANPCTGVELPAVPESGEIRFLTLDEVDRLVEHARPGEFQALDRAIFLTAAMTGLRKGELLALRWKDVDWTAGRIRVRQNYVRGEFGTPKSKRSSRSVPMADEVAGELDRLCTQSRWQGEDDLVFAHRLTGGPLPKANVTRRMRAALKAAKLDTSHRFHDLRHTFGTMMAAAGVPMRTLQEWMGHRDLATTQRYADYAPSTREAEMVAAAVAHARGSIRGSNLSKSQMTSADANDAVEPRTT
jgi:integrase